MALGVRPRIATLDHATVPSVDLVADLEFYERSFGAALLERKPGRRPPMVNLSIARRKAGRAPIFFLEIAGVSGFGLFLQDDYPPQSRRMLEGPRYGFAVTADDLVGAAAHLCEHSVTFQGPVPHPPPSPFNESIYLKDPSENSLELCTLRDPSVCKRRAPAPRGLIPLSGLCHVAVDVTHLEQGEEFYVEGLGLVPLGRGSAADGLNASMLLTAQGHVVTLQHVDAMSPRSTKRYLSDTHFALTIAHADCTALEQEMSRRNVPLLPDYVAGDGRRPQDQKSVYVVDPFGNNVQIFTVRERSRRMAESPSAE